MKQLILLFLFFCQILLASYTTYGKLDSSSSRITFITNTSIIPGHPTTEMLEKSFQSWYLKQPEFKDMPKIIVFDELPNKSKNNPSSREIDYEEYKKRCKALVDEHPYFRNTLLVFLKQHGHLNIALRAALRCTETEYVFIHQHDFILLHNIDIDGILLSMDENPFIKYVRLTLDINLPHGNSEIFVEPYLGHSRVPLCVSYNWSAHEHFAKKSYYEDFVFHHTKYRCISTERVLAHPVRNACRANPSEHTKYGLFLYGRYNEGPFVRHLDGRNWGRKR